jgi:cardiolipin synthase
VVFGEDFGDAMARMFRRDLANSRPITAKEWAERPLLQRTKEGLARLFERLW